MIVLKLRKIGNSIGITLPREMLERLRAKKGHKIFAIETPGGCMLTALDQRVQKQVEAGEALIDRYRDVLAALGAQVGTESNLRIVPRRQN